MKPKGSKSARPRHHVYFLHSDTFLAEDCARLKHRIHEAAPFFDGNALDAARFIFGCSADDVIWHEGSRTIEDFLDEQDFEDFDRETEIIGEGPRNSTMSRIAGRIIKRYGNTDEAYQLYLKKSELCNPPLEQEELDTIWNSAVKFWKKISVQPGYIPPEEYGSGWGLKPDDYSDIGQAKVLARECGGELVYTDATNYMRYDGTRWAESKQLAVGACEDFLDRQLTEARAAVEAAKKKLLKAGVSKEDFAAGGKTLEKVINGNSLLAYNEFCAAVVYQKFVMKRRDVKYIESALAAAKPMLLKDIKEFDSQEFLLNTPDGVYCLGEGICGRCDHSPDDYITKITAVAPSDEGMDLWLDALNTFFCGDAELIEYVQQTVGLAAIGKVYQEALIIAYGEGRNGKSTFWNAIAKVLGSYSGALSAEALTVGVKRNVKPEMAEIKGKRLIIAAELEEGMRLNTSVVKQLCSTDEIEAEKKYKDPFKYKPGYDGGGVKMARRSKGEGSLYQASDKSWVCQYKVDGQRRTKRFKRKSDAKAFMDALSAAIPEVPAAFAGQPQSRAATVMTLGEWMDRWLEDYARPTVKLSTYGSYELYIRAHIKPQIGGLYLNTLTTDDLQRFFNERGKSGNLKVDGGLAPKTLTNMRNMLHLALDQAVKNRLMQGNVVEGVRLPKNQRQEMRVLDREEQERLIMAARLAPEPAAFGIIFDLFTGLRLGELCGLQWENVSMEHQVFQVCETRNRLPNYDASIEAATSVRTVATTKTENSRRTVYLLDDLFHDLESYKAIQDSIARQYPGYNPDGYVFCQENGQPYEPRTYQDLFKRCVRQAGIPDANFHALRHTFATRSLEQGMDVVTLSRLLGHANPSITLDKYGHALDDHKKASIGKLGELYSGTRKMPPANTRSGAAKRGWER